MGNNELSKVLELHKKWLYGEPYGIRADLGGANLRGADLRGADLGGADLGGANLRDANLVSIVYDVYTSFIDLQCPSVGAFIAWKRCGEYIVKLRVTERSKRSSATSRKCRCSEAEVLEIQNADGGAANVTSVVSSYDTSFHYCVGKIVRVDNFCEDRWQECAPGIHFFITRSEAVNRR